MRADLVRRRYNGVRDLATYMLYLRIARPELLDYAVRCKILGECRIGGGIKKVVHNIAQRMKEKLFGYPSKERIIAWLYKRMVEKVKPGKCPFCGAENPDWVHIRYRHPAELERFIDELLGSHR